MPAVIRKVGETLGKESDPELQSLVGAALVRLSSEASSHKQFGALNELCITMEALGKQRPVLVTELRPRIGIENRLPEFIEEALHLPQAPTDLLQVLKRTSQAAIEHLADRFFRCMRRQPCDRMVDLVTQLGPPGLQRFLGVLRTGQPRQAASGVGLLWRLAIPSL